MLRVGRRRTKRKDLPVGLYCDKYGTYYFLDTKSGPREYKSFGKVSREVAIKAWLDYRHLEETGDAGTLGELLDLYLRLGRDGQVDKTWKEYQRIIGKLRERWGAREYSYTADEAARSGAFRLLDVSMYLRAARIAPRGAIGANREIAVLSNAFVLARQHGLTEYNACIGAPRAPERPRKLRITEEIIDAEAVKLNGAIKLMVVFAKLSGWRQTDIRLLRWSQVDERFIWCESSKTDVRVELARSDAINSVLEQAKKLRGNLRSMYVFCNQHAQPYSEGGLATMLQRAKLSFQFRDIRKWAINDKDASGEDSTDFAGHRDQATTRRHYLSAPKRVTPTR